MRYSALGANHKQKNEQQSTLRAFKTCQTSEKTI